MVALKKSKHIIAKEIVNFKSGFAQGMGLRFKKKNQCIDKAFVFQLHKKSKPAIDMLFVSFALDLIFLDENKRIIELKENLKPFQTYKPSKNSMYFIELLSGEIKKNNIKLNDVLEF
jgi:hypothetical protein